MMKKSQMLGIVGTILEWYDFTLYAYLATVLSPKFFPHNNPLISLIMTYSVFALGFFVRPLGGIFFGNFGDKYGRKKALLLSLSLMTFSTFFIGVLPTYESIGVLAPLFLIILRIFQGFSAAGQLTGATSFFFETIKEKKGFWCSLIWASSGIGMLIAAAIVAIINILFSKDLIYLYAWRLPFLISIITLFSVICLQKSQEKEIFFEEVKETTVFPIKEAFAFHKRKILYVFLLYSLCAVTIYSLFVFMPTYLEKIVHIKAKESSLINTLNMTVMVGILPFFGWLSDKISGFLLMRVSIVGFIFFSYPLYVLLSTGNIFNIIVGELAFAILTAIYNGAITKIVLEKLPIHVRYTITAFGYNLAYALLGGLAPLASLYLIHITLNICSPAFYIIMGAVFSFAGLALFSKQPSYDR